MKVAKEYAARKLEANHGLGNIDIVIPYHGQYERVARLIQSLWNQSTNYKNKIAYTQGCVYNLYLVDDGSSNDSFGKDIQETLYPGIHVIRNEERLGFGASVNIGISKGNNPWILILHSDVVLEGNHWLQFMGDSYFRLRNNGVKMIGATMDRVNNGDPRCRSKTTDDIILEPVSISDLVDQEMYLPLVCVLFHRDLISRIGRFKEYPIACYEDIEFACRMFSSGFKQAICGKSFVHHYAGSTIDAITKLENKARKQIEDNFQRCCLDIKKLTMSFKHENA